MLKLIRFLWGYVVFSAVGTFPEQFINLAAKTGVGLFNVKIKDDVLYCAAMASEYKTIKKLARKSSTKIKIQSKHGMPFFIKKYKKRKGIFVGLICFCLTLYFLSLYIWSVNIQGIYTIDKNQIDNLIAELGIGVGTLRSELDTPMIEKSIMNHLNDVSWVSANVTGSTLNLEFKERVQPPELVPKVKPCNVKAAKEGQIVRMEVYEGTPEIHNGDAVVKGQLLINGIVEDAFGDCSIRHADAKVYAKTKHIIQKEVDLCQIEKVKNGKDIVRKRLKLFGIELPLTLVPKPSGNYEKSLQVDNLNIVGVSLPLTYYKEVFTPFYEQKHSLTQEQAQNKALDELKKEEVNQLKDIKILNVDTKYRLSNGKIILTATYLCEENIAFQEEIKME